MRLTMHEDGSVQIDLEPDDQQITIKHRAGVGLGLGWHAGRTRDWPPGAGRPSLPAGAVFAARRKRGAA